MSRLLCNLFYYDSEELYTDSMFEEMWDHDKNEFILILFYLRMHRRNFLKSTTNKVTGRGERKIFHQAIRWMSFHKLDELRLFLPYIPDCGYWKDLLVLMGTPAEFDVVSLFGTQLIKDYVSFTQQIPGLISLAAKWTPNEGSRSDKQYNTNMKIAKFMGISHKILRSQYLVPLRKYLQVTEQMVTDKKWNTINYNTVPRLSMKRHTKTFQRNDYIRFTDHINNSHNSNYLSTKELPDPVSKLLSKELPETRTSIVTDNDSIFAIDVSGAMSGFPITIGACLCGNSNVSQWIPFRFDEANEENMEINVGEAITFANNDFNERIGSVINCGVTGYNIDTCIKIGKDLGKSHIIFVSNMLLDISEIPTDPSIHITYWCLTINPTVIINDKATLGLRIDDESDVRLTMIEGYDINIYNELQRGCFLLRNGYKDIIISMIRAENLLPNL